MTSLCAVHFHVLVIVFALLPGASSIQVQRQSGASRSQHEEQHADSNFGHHYTTGLHDEEQQLCRSYLKKVYPVAARKFDASSDEQVLDMLRGLIYFYEPLPQIGYPLPLIDPSWRVPWKGEPCSTKLQDVFASLTQPKGEQIVFETVGELLKHTKEVWDSIDFAHPNSSWPAWIRESVLKEGAHIEVTHFAGNSHNALGKVQSESDKFLDDQPWVTAWYYVRKGSGIFYAAGRSKTAINKNHMLLLLWREFQEKRPERRASFSSLFIDFWQPWQQAGLLPEPDQLESALEATLRGKKCKGFECWNEWNLQDAADEAIVWLGRECDYDTLIFAASPVDDETLVMELVDLRLPVEGWRADAQQRRYHSRSKMVERWMQRIHDEMILSVRDPFDPNSDVSVRPCGFQLASNQLYCNGTLSEESRLARFSPC